MQLATVAARVLTADRWDNDHMWGGGGWMWLWGTLMMAVWVGLVALVVWAVARRPQERQAPPSDRAREILAERYARGEIGADEYRERLEALR